MYPNVRKLIAENINILVRGERCRICGKKMSKHLKKDVEHFTYEHYDVIDDIVALITIVVALS